MSTLLNCIACLCYQKYTTYYKIALLDIVVFASVLDALRRDASESLNAGLLTTCNNKCAISTNPNPNVEISDFHVGLIVLADF